MSKFLPKNIFKIDKKVNLPFLYLNRKSISFFFFNKKYSFTHVLSHQSFYNWSYFYSRMYGFNKHILFLFLRAIGCNINLLFTNLNEYSFLLIKLFLKKYEIYFSLSWYLLYLKERHFLLPIFYRGNRFIKHLPSRGQRSRSNYKICKKRQESYSFLSFKKHLTLSYIETNYPNWKHLESFYFFKY